MHLLRIHDTPKLTPSGVLVRSTIHLMVTRIPESVWVEALPKFGAEFLSLNFTRVVLRLYTIIPLYLAMGFRFLRPIHQTKS